MTFCSFSMCTSTTSYLFILSLCVLSQENNLCEMCEFCKYRDHTLFFHALTFVGS